MDSINFEIVERTLDNLESYLESLPTEDLRETPEEQTTEEPQSPLLPENSPTLLMDETTTRFSSAIWYDKIQRQSITLAGLGGIGSYVAFLLGRLKPASLVLYDSDTVEATNMAGQLYGNDCVGLNKSEATAYLLRNFSIYYNTTSVQNRFIGNSYITNIAICGFDNMASRKVFYEAWKRHLESVSMKDECLFIDGRLAAEEFQVFCFTGADTYLMNKYEKDWLFSDAEAEETLCSYKQTSFCANMIGSIMVNLFVNFIANHCDPLYPRALPFLTSFNASTLILKTEM